MRIQISVKIDVWRIVVHGKELWEEKHHGEMVKIDKMLIK